MNTCFNDQFKKEIEWRVFSPSPPQPPPLFFLPHFTLHPLEYLEHFDYSGTRRLVWGRKKERHQIYATVLFKWAELGTLYGQLYGFPYLKFICSNSFFARLPQMESSQATSHLKTDHVLAPRLRAVSYFSLQSYCKRNPRRLSFSSGPSPLL